MLATQRLLTRRATSSRALGRRVAVNGVRSLHKPAVCFQVAGVGSGSGKGSGKGMVSSHPRIASERNAAWGAGQRRGMMSAMAVEEEDMNDMEYEDVIKGPLDQYQQWVSQGRLRDDEYQRGIVMNLQKLHDDLQSYHPPIVVHPSLAAVTAPQRTSFIGALLGWKPSPPTTQIPANMPKGMYLFGEVGSGKTMLMDMFYNTLPAHITSKTRIHFHHFMQEVHRRLHRLKMQYGTDFDAIPFVGADIASGASVLCFDEFQCTDVADAMILRRLLESLMSHGIVMVATSNRHPDDLYKNGIQRQSFLPCIALLNNALTVINLNSPTDYRKIPRPASGVYHHHPLGAGALAHADKWFTYLGDSAAPPRPRSHTIWGREVKVPMASGKAARFKFSELCGSATSAADYLELCRHYRAFVVTDVPAMDHRSRDLARRFITFVDAVYESKAKLVLTTTTPLNQLFVSEAEVKSAMEGEGEGLDVSMRSLMDDLGMSMKMLKDSNIFSGDEERFAFARALSRLSEMGSVQWIERD